MTSEEPKPRGYKDLIVWQKTMQLVKSIYLLTRDFPRDERFGLISQMRRAAVASNIASRWNWTFVRKKLQLRLLAYS